MALGNYHSHRIQYVDHSFYLVEYYLYGLKVAGTWYRAFSSICAMNVLAGSWWIWHILRTGDNLLLVTVVAQ